MDAGLQSRNSRNAPDIGTAIAQIRGAAGPGALLVGSVLALRRLGQGEVFRGAQGKCPFCGVQQSFTVLGRYRLPKQLYCSSCHRQLVLQNPTTELLRSPT